MTEKILEKASAKVLVVDDEPTVLRLLNTILNRAKYKVTTAESGPEALQILEKEIFDCIVTDTVMPLMTGYDLARTIRRLPHQNQIPILMLTRKNKREDVAKALQSGVSDYIIKPVDELLLLDKIAQLLNVHSGHEAANQVFEVPVSEPELIAQLKLPCRIVLMSETKMTVRFLFPFTRQLPFSFQTTLFEKIGITEPILKVSGIRDLGENASDEYRYEVGFSFLGLSEIELQKVRAWVLKQSIRLRK